MQGPVDCGHTSKAEGPVFSQTSLDARLCRFSPEREQPLCGAAWTPHLCKPDSRSQSRACSSQNVPAGFRHKLCFYTEIQLHA